jgi:hypothetical protein
MGVLFRPVVVNGKQYEIERVLSKIIDPKLEALKTVSFQDSRFIRLIAWNGAEYEQIDGHEGQKDYQYTGTLLSKETMVIITETGAIKTVYRDYTYTGSNLTQVSRWTVSP